jgi:DNA-directed RNA polymerase specialized sigma24 family protein
MGRAPWRRGAWTAQEAAAVLQGRRGELVRELARRSDAVGVPAGVQEEIVDEAICAVVMMRRPLVSERHLLGAFWVMVRALVARYRQGRRDLRLGSRRRVPLDEIELAAEGLAAEEVVELADSARRAADLIAQLSEIEARVVLVKATRGIGAKAAARDLGLPVKDARAAARSAQGKLEMVAAIAAAGRMCAYREGAVVAHARGEAFGEQARVARAHLRACASCRVEYRRLRREMRGRDWQRSAAAVFLPMPAAGGGHGGWLERVAGWLSARHIAPRGVGERTAEAAGAAGGVGVVKATAAGTAIIAATATVAGGLHALVIPAAHHSHQRPHPHVAVVSAVAAAPAPVAVSQPMTPPPTLAPAAGAASARPSAQVLAARRRAQAEAKASKAEREFGPEGEASAGGGGSGQASSEAQAAAPVAHAASVSPSPAESSAGSPSGSSASESSGPRQSAGESQAEREFGPQ